MANDEVSAKYYLVYVKTGDITCYTAEAIKTTTSCVWVEFEQYSKIAAGNSLTRGVFCTGTKCKQVQGWW